MTLIQDGAALLGVLGASGGRVALAMLVWVSLMLVLPLVAIALLLKWAGSASQKVGSQARPAAHPSPTAPSPPADPAPPSTRAA